jgi:hypothetical protein
MPNKTVYVRDGDVGLWEKAEQLAGESLSAFLTDALRRHVSCVEREAKLKADEERIVVEVSDGEGHPIKKAFRGTWLVRDWGPEGWGAARTAAGRIAVLELGGLQVFENLDELDAWGEGIQQEFDDDEMDQWADGKVLEFVALVAAALGEDYVVELDI